MRFGMAMGHFHLFLYTAVLASLQLTRGAEIAEQDFDGLENDGRIFHATRSATLVYKQHDAIRCSTFTFYVGSKADEMASLI